MAATSRLDEIRAEMAKNKEIEGSPFDSDQALEAGAEADASDVNAESDTAEDKQ